MDAPPSPLEKKSDGERELRRHPITSTPQNQTQTPNQDSQTPKQDLQFQDLQSPNQDLQFQDLQSPNQDKDSQSQHQHQDEDLQLEYQDLQLEDQDLQLVDLSPSPLDPHYASTSESEIRQLYIDPSLPETPPDSKKNSKTRKYNRISSSPSANVSELRLAKRVADVQDAEYGMVLLLTIIATVILWASTYVREVHSTLLPWNSVGTKVFLTGIAVACSMVAWVISGHGVRVRVTAEGLRNIPVLASALSLLLTVYILAKGWWLLALVMATYLLADASHFYKLGEDAEFAAVMLQIVDAQLTGSIRTICRAMLVLQIKLVVIWSWFFVDLIQCHMVATASFTGVLTVFLTYLLLFWVSGVLRGMVSLVASGVLSEELLDHNHSQQSKGVRARLTKGELTTLLIRRSLSTSFGTCCAGSIRLLLASLMLSLTKMVETLEALFLRLRARSRSCSHRGGSPSASASFNMHRRYEEIFEFATGYCWARAALRGCRFSVASHVTWQRINRNGMDFAVFGTYTEYVFQYLSFLLATVFGLLAVFILHFFNKATYSVLFVFAIMGICTVIAQMVFEPWRSAVSVILVCYTEQPSSLSEPYPVLYHRFLRISEVEAFNKVHQGRSTSTASMLGEKEMEMEKGMNEEEG